MKLSDQILTANHNLFRNKTRTILTIIAIFIGSFTIVMSSALNAGVNAFIDKQVESIGGDGFIEVFPAAMYDQLAGMMGSGSSKVTEYNPNEGSAITATISKSDLKKMQEVDGVKVLEMFHFLAPEWMTSNNTDKKYSVSLEYFPDSEFTVDLSAGRMTDNNSDENEIIINQNWLEPLGFSSPEDAVGKEVTVAVKETAKCYEDEDNCLETLTGTIVGVQAPGVLTMDGDLHVNKAFDAAIYDISVRNLPKEATKRNDITAVGEVDPEKMSEIREKFRELGFESITIDDAVGMIRTFLDVMVIILDVFGGIALLAAVIGIVNTLFMSVQERTREIGLMKAMGMSNSGVFLSFSLEAILLGFWGSAFGIAASMLIGFFANKIATDTFLADFPTLSLTKFEPLTMLTITAVIMLIAFVAGTLPARRAAKKNPIDALRYE
ncbi:ABC transporter permease [Candidatus Saccharibacteria bacterium]|nr:ABC transporter permease [Candidatus Saccharibacteria bacterium]